MKIEWLRFAQPLFLLNPQSIPLVQTGKAIMKNEIDISEALRHKPFMKICMIAACVIFCLYIISSFVFGMAKIRPYLPLCLVIMGCFFAAAGIYCLWIGARRSGLKILLASIIMFGLAVVVYVWRQYLLAL